LSPISNFRKLEIGDEKHFHVVPQLTFENQPNCRNSYVVLPNCPWDSVHLTGDNNSVSYCHLIFQENIKNCNGFQYFDKIAFA
jgi:hypothetical protein